MADQATAQPNVAEAPKPAAQAEASVTTPVVPTQSQQDPKISSRFAALSRKERSIVQKQQDIAEREKRLAEREAQLAAQDQEWERDPYSAAQKRGLSYEKWTDRVLNEGKPTPADAASQAAKAEIEKFRKQQAQDAEKAAKEAKERSEAEAAQVIEEYKQEIGEFVKTNAEKFELITLHKTEGLVYDTINAYFDQTKKILSIEEACNLVEAHLEEQVLASVKTKKLQAKVTPQPAKSEEAPKSDPSPASSSSPTLNSQMSSSTPSYLPAATEEERIKRAMAALEKAKK